MNKEERNAYNKKWNQDNKERVLEQKKQYYQDNKEKKKQYYQDNKERISERKKQYRLDNKEKISEQQKRWLLDNKEYKKQWYQDNKERISERKKAYNKQWYQDNKEEIKQYNKQYNLDNKERILEKNKQYQNKQYHSDPLFKFKMNCRSRTGTAFKKKSWRKNGGTEKLLGCDWKTAMNHIESQFVGKNKWMNWDNHGEWEIDHIIPLGKANTKEEMNLLFNYKNLQPLLAEDNRRKGDRIL